MVHPRDREIQLLRYLWLLPPRSGIAGRPVESLCLGEGLLASQQLGFGGHGGHFDVRGWPFDTEHRDVCPTRFEP